MGKNLNKSKLVPRTGKMAFYQVPESDVFTRMEGFTDLSNSKNAKEYTRRYVDEDTDRTDTTGYAASTAYAFDMYDDNAVLDDIVKIHEDEMIGNDAVRTIIQVDMTTVKDSGGKITVDGRMRDYAVVPDADGSSTDALTYSGNFKARGEIEEVTVESDDDFQTVKISAQPLAAKLAVKIAKE